MSVTGNFASEQTKAQKTPTKIPIRESTAWLIVAITKKDMRTKFRAFST